MGSPGRLRVIISKDQLSGLAKMFGVSARTLHRRRFEFVMHIGRNCKSISEIYLDDVIRALCRYS